LTLEQFFRHNASDRCKLIRGFLLGNITLKEAEPMLLISEVHNECCSNCTREAIVKIEIDGMTRLLLCRSCEKALYDALGGDEDERD
jgi:hypothetical protein